MKRAAFAIAVSLLVSRIASADETSSTSVPTPPDSPHDDARGRGGVALSMRAGVARAPFDAASFPFTNGQAMTLVLAGWLAIRPETWLVFRAPLVIASVAQPAGSYADEAAWASPMLGIETHAIAWHTEGLALRAIVGGSVAAPLAEHASSLMPNRALAVGSAIDGPRTPELFVPGVVPFTGHAGLDLSSARWSVRARARIPVLVRVSHADQSAAHAASTLPVVGAGAGVWILRTVAATLDVDVALPHIAPPFKLAPGSAVAQLVVTPSLVIRLGERGGLVLSAVLPVAGEEGASTAAGGVAGDVVW